MNKKLNFAKMALLSALLCGLASPTFVGCKDYDDDIKDLQEQIDANKSAATQELSKAISEQITALENKLNTAIADKADKGVIEGLQADINALKALESRVKALEDATSNYLKEGALDDYLKKGELDGYVTEDALDGLLNEDALEQYLKDHNYLQEGDVTGIPTETIVRAWLADELVELQELVDLFNANNGELKEKLPNLISDVDQLRQDLDALMGENGDLKKLQDKITAFENTITDITFPGISPELNFIQSTPLENEIVWVDGTVLKAGTVLSDAKAEFPVILNPSSVKLTDKFVFTLVDAAGKNVPVKVISVNKEWEIKDMTNPFVSRSSEAVVNKDIYTATVRYEGTTDVKMGNLALKVVLPGDDQNFVLSNYAIKPVIGIAKDLTKVTVSKKTVYLGVEYDVNEIAQFTFKKANGQVLFPEGIATAAANLYTGKGYVKIHKDDEKYLKYLDAEALKEGIILANETQTNVEFELDGVTLNFEYYAMDLNGSGIKKADFQVTFITQMYDKNVTFEDLTIEILAETGNVSEELKFKDILSDLTSKQFDRWKENAENFKCVITDAEGEKVDAIKAEFSADNDGFKLSATSKAEAGDYNVVITFEDKRTGEEGLFNISGKVTVVAPTIEPNLSVGYWKEGVLTIPGVFKEGAKFDLSVDLLNAFVIDVPGVAAPTMEFKLNREDLAGCVEIKDSKVTWLKNVEEDGEVTENLFEKELEFTVSIKNGNLVLAEQVYKLKFVNPLAKTVEKNGVKCTLANDKDGITTSTFDLYKLLSFKDTQAAKHELFGISGTTSTGDFNEIGTTCYELIKSNVKFEIVTANTNLTIDDQGIATWKNVEGAAFTGANIDVNVTITHKYGTSTGTIKLEVKEKASK